MTCAELEPVAHSGWLWLQRDSLDGRWVRCYARLHRCAAADSPFLLMSASQSGSVRLAILLHGAHVFAQDEETVGASHAFGLYTPNNSYLLRAPSADSAAQWMYVEG